MTSSSLQTRCAIRPARSGDVDRLLVIEDDAGLRFAGSRLIDPALDTGLSRQRLERLVESAQVWVACIAGSGAVGMIVASARQQDFYIEEVDVLRLHGRRGIGTALLRHACLCARQRGHRRALLSTFRNVPWNAPWYARLGFAVLEAGRWSPELQGIRAAEARRGLSIADRIFMSLDLAGSGQRLFDSGKDRDSACASS